MNQDLHGVLICLLNSQKVADDGPQQTLNRLMKKVKAVCPEVEQSGNPLELQLDELRLSQETWSVEDFKKIENHRHNRACARSHIRNFGNYTVDVP